MVCSNVDVHREAEQDLAPQLIQHAALAQKCG